MSYMNEELIIFLQGQLNSVDEILNRVPALNGYHKREDKIRQAIREASKVSLAENKLCRTIKLIKGKLEQDRQTMINNGQTRTSSGLYRAIMLVDEAIKEISDEK